MEGPEMHVTKRKKAESYTLNNHATFRERPEDYEPEKDQWLPVASGEGRVTRRSTGDI